VVVVSYDQLGSAVIETDTSRTVPTLRVMLRNVGLAPALDLRLTVSGYGQRSREEVVPVVLVGDVLPIHLSLTAMKAPEEGCWLYDLVVEGTFFDRRQDERYPITIINAAGLIDQQREGAERTLRRAWPWVSMVGGLERIDVADDADHAVVRRYAVYHCS